MCVCVQTFSEYNAVLACFAEHWCGGSHTMPSVCVCPVGPSISSFVWLVPSISQIEYTYNLLSCGRQLLLLLFSFLFHFRLQSSAILYCLNNIYYGCWNEIQFICDAHTHTLSTAWMGNVRNAWAFIKCGGVHFLCFNDLYLWFSTGLHSFPSKMPITFFVRTHICSVLFTKIVWLILLFISCFNNSSSNNNRNVIPFIRLEIVQLFMNAMPLPSPIAVHNHKSCKLSVCVFVFLRNRD